MRLIRPADAARERRWALALSLAMLMVGIVAIGLMALLPDDKPDGVAVLGVAAALGIGIGLAWLIRALSGHGQQRVGEDLARLLEPTFDDSYVLIISPRLPSVPGELAALLIGPAGARPELARPRGRSAGRASSGRAPVARALPSPWARLGVRHPWQGGLDPVPHQPVIRRRRGCRCGRRVGANRPR